MASTLSPQNLSDILSLSQSLRPPPAPSLDDIPPLLRAPTSPQFTSTSIPSNTTRLAILTSCTPFGPPPLPPSPTDPIWLSRLSLDNHRLRSNNFLRLTLRHSMTDACIDVNEDLVNLVSNSQTHIFVPRTALFSYNHVIKSIALTGEARSVAVSFLETAGAVGDLPHFIESVGVLNLVSVADRPGGHNVVWGSRMVLENLEAKRINGLDEQHRLMSPNVVVPLVRRYVRHRLNRDMHTLWTSVYVCMRIGHLDAAVYLLEETGRHCNLAVISVFKEFLRGRNEIMSWLDQKDDVDDYYDPSMPSSPGLLQGIDWYERLEREYSTAWEGDDVYMRACYVLLMRLEFQSAFGGMSDAGDISHHPLAGKHERFSLSFPESDIRQLFDTMEDYLWFRLWLCRTPVEVGFAEELSHAKMVQLSAVQSEILSYGPRHFDHATPLFYAFILVCVGFFEQAILFLRDSKDCLHYSIHLSIILYHLDWHTDHVQHEKLIHKFVSSFGEMYPTEAVLYVLTLKSKGAIRDILVDLIMTSGDYRLFLGVPSSDKQGILYDLLDNATTPSGFSKEDVVDLRKSVAESGARLALQSGDYSKATYLYRLAGLSGRSAEMIVINLSTCIHINQSAKRKPAILDAATMLNHSIPQATRTLLQRLISISKIFDDYWAGRYASAWVQIRNLDIIPLTPDAMGACQRKYFVEGARLKDLAMGLLDVSLQISELDLEGVCVEGEIKCICMFAGMVGTGEVG